MFKNNCHVYLLLIMNHVCAAKVDCITIFQTLVIFNSIEISV